MKHLVIMYLLITSVLLLVFSSCSENTSVFSCDPEVEVWTKTNIATYQAADRSKIVSLPYDRQMAVFRGLSSEKKVSLWMDKLNIIMKDEKLSSAEKDAIKSAILFLSPEHYETASGKRAFDKFAEEWKKQMISDFHWSEDKFFWYTETWMSEDEFKEAIIAYGMNTLRMSTRSEPEEQLEDCFCETDAACSFGMGYYRCNTSGKCKPKPYGCGLLGTKSCTGKCE